MVVTSATLTSEYMDVNSYAKMSDNLPFKMTVASSNCEFRAGADLHYQLDTPEGQQIPKTAQLKEYLGGGYFGSVWHARSAGQDEVIKLATYTTGADPNAAILDKLEVVFKGGGRAIQWWWWGHDLFPPRTKEVAIRLACLTSQLLYDVTRVGSDDGQPMVAKVYGYTWFGSPYNSYALVAEYINGRGPAYPSPDIYMLRRALRNAVVSFGNRLSKSMGKNEVVPLGKPPHEMYDWFDFQRRLDWVNKEYAGNAFVGLSHQWAADDSFLAPPNAVREIHSGRLVQVDTTPASPPISGRRWLENWVGPPVMFCPDWKTPKLLRSIWQQAQSLGSTDPSVERLYTDVLRKAVQAHRDRYVAVLGERGLEEFETKIALWDRLWTEYSSGEVVIRRSNRSDRAIALDPIHSTRGFRNATINWQEKISKIEAEDADRYRKSSPAYYSYLLRSTTLQLIESGFDLTTLAVGRGFRLLTNKDTWLAVGKSIVDTGRLIIDSDFRTQVAKEHFLSGVRYALRERKLTDQECQDLAESFHGKEVVNYALLQLFYVGLKPLELPVGAAGLVGSIIQGDITPFVYAYLAPAIVREIPTLYMAIKNPDMKFTIPLIVNFLPGGSWYGIPFQMMDKYPDLAGHYIRQLVPKMLRFIPGYGEKDSLLEFYANRILVDLPAAVIYEVSQAAAKGLQPVKDKASYLWDEFSCRLPDI